MLEGQDVNDGGQESNAADLASSGQDTGGDLKGNSLMTKPEGEGGDKGIPDPDKSPDKEGDKSQDKGADKEQEQEKKADDPASKVPDKPEGYELAFSEGIQIDTDLLSSFQQTAHEMGIPQGQAQALAAMYEAHATKAAGRAVEAQQKALDEARAKWESDIEKSPSFAQDREHIRSALRQYGDAELYDLLDQTNLGSHPKMWAFMAKVGKALAEPGFHGKSSGKAQTAADVLYPNHGK